MKAKRQKHVRKVLTFYKTNFDVQPPYTVLLDGTFCKAALKFKINISEQLPKYLDTEVKLITTKCVLAECEAFGSLLYGPLKVLQQFTCLQCGHETAQSASACIMKQAKKKQKKYIIATQDGDLSDKIRRRPGVPLLYISHNAMTLESPSEHSIQIAKGTLNDRLNASKSEHATLEALKRAVFGEPEVMKKRKKKGPKGPNPLSCKKKKKNVTGLSVESKTSKKSKRKKRKIEGDASVS